MSVRLPSPLSSLGHITLVLYGMCCILSCFSIQLCVTLWTPTCQTPLSMGLSMQEYWSGLLCPPPGDLLNPGIEPASLMSNLHWQEGSLPLAPHGKSPKIISTFPFLLTRDETFFFFSKWLTNAFINLRNSSSLLQRSLELVIVLHDYSNYYNYLKVIFCQ